MNTTGNDTGYYDKAGWHLSSHTKNSFYIALGLQWLNTILIISLNTAVIVIIYRYKKKSRLYFLLMNMAIADLSTGVIDALVNALERTLGIEYLNYWWFGGDFFCKLQRTLSSTSLCASNFILAATSIDRALVVAKPMLNFKRGNTLQKILIALCWLFSAAISSPLIAIHSQESYNPYYIKGVQNIPHCSENLDLGGWKMLFYLMLVFYVLIPLSVIIVSYCILIFAIYKRARSPPNSIHGIDNLRIPLVFNRGLPRSKVRSVKLTFGIVLSFIGAWTPFFVIMYMHLFQDLHDPVVMLFITTYYWNCSVNPIIFFVFHRRKDGRTTYSFYSSDTPMNKLNMSKSSIRNTPTRILVDSENIPLKSVNSTKNMLITSDKNS